MMSNRIEVTLVDDSLQDVIATVNIDEEFMTGFFFQFLVELAKVSEGRMRRVEQFDIRGVSRRKHEEW